VTVSKTSGTTSSLATATSSKRLSGLISGLDTDTLVQQLTSGMQSKIDKQMQTKQIAQWRQQSYREVTKALTEFKNKYFSSATSSNSILSSDFFNSTSINNTSSFLNVSGSSSTAKNMVITGISSLAKQASFSSSHPVSDGKITTGALYSEFASSKVTGESITINYGGKDYKVAVSSDLMLGSGTDSAEDAQSAAKAIADNLNEQIAKTDGIKGNVVFDVNASGNVVLSTTASGTGNIGITDGDTDLLTGLGLAKGSPSTSPITGGDLVAGSLYTGTSLGDTLDGSTLTFSLNGLTKNITFKDTDKSQYSTPEDLVSYLNDQLKTAYGAFDSADNTNGYGKVSAKLNSDGSLSVFSISSLNADGSIHSAQGTDVLTISSSDKSGILGVNGALRVYAGESNRINTNKTLEDLTGLKTALTGADSDGSYKINVNGKDFTFKSTDTVSTIMNTINNDSDANVTLTYSNTTNTFSAIAKNGGANGKVDISDVTGNLATALFGTVSERAVTSGNDAKMTISFDGNPAHATTITRSDNNFTLDGVNFELLKETDTTVSSSTPIKFTVNNKTDDLVTKIKDFITDYNNIIKLTNGKVNESTKTNNQTFAPLTDSQKKDMSESEITSWETNAKKGLLQNDSLLSSLSLNMRLAMTDQVSSISTALYQIGIATKEDFQVGNTGVLTIDEDKLKKALTDDPDKVAALFTSSDGIATKLQDIINTNVNTSLVDTGLLITKAGSDDSTVDQSTLAKTMNDCETKITSLKTTLATQQEQYYAKFTKLEQYLSQMNSQASWFGSSSSSDS